MGVDSLGAVNAVLRYTAARFGFFALPFVMLIYVLGMRMWFVAAAVALLVSAPASFFLLSRQRDQVSSVVAGKVQRFSRRIEDDAAAEDSAHAQRHDD